MTVSVHRWSSREVKALREAQRLSVRDFAAQLGVSDRAVSKWEAGGRLKPESQSILDTALSRSPDEVRARFAQLLSQASAASAEHDAPPASNDMPEQLPTSVRHPVDGRKMQLIPAGVYLSGATDEPVWLPDYYIDLTPVTNAEYALFVAATNYRVPSHWENGSYPEGYEKHPVVNVTYWDARSYARWARKSLPTASQWEKAARGSRGFKYPWGNQETPAKCNVRENNVGRTTPVTCYHSGTSPYGVYDLSGNVWEWCDTETSPGRYMLKGSAFTSPLELAAGAAENDASADMFDDDTGFRCSCTPDSLEELN